MEQKRVATARQGVDRRCNGTAKKRNVKQRR
nr:MAG TPA: hypothetical protein [Caudoviricetes sp.]